MLRRWRTLADDYDPERVLVGETWVELDELASFYGTKNDELHLAFNFAFVFAGLNARERAELVSRTSGLLLEGAWPVWTLSNHDVLRFPTRLCGGDDAKTNAALLFLLSLRGTPVLYYGDELGMRQVEIPPERTLDVHDRDGARLTLGTNTPTVSVQKEDTGSVLIFCRELLRLRRAHADLTAGSYAELGRDGGVWSWRRGEQIAVAVNLSEEGAESKLEGDVLLSTRGRGELPALAPWEGVVVLRA